MITYLSNIFNSLLNRGLFYFHYRTAFSFSICA
uniref:Uncharacterized protein n=1 Tax=Salmonella phage PMBT37 TaxID=3153515 RepID=A0AAU8GKN7_9CAUD